MKSKFGKVILAGVLGLCLATNATAATIKDLQGAWTMNGTKCEDTFKKVGKTIEFKDRTASTSTGLLISGSKVTGPNAVCTTKSVKKQKDRLSATLSCTDSMIESDMTQTFKIVDANTFQRFDPFGDNMYVTYQKCDM
ncbi:hypothetical protein [Phyllobacterium zundukense]|jgi:hypothetical protein|uniref:Uncharacterized protein n=1 Tax=Phyllobacterium zundukense TaxID=1867719 RepID=A0ACD4CU02_9HYPH|nr:hypothetical protein [Phyllobacterium zundukense]UXN57050.1 hypothetical protein N8E88_01050 [Phyllobacterium zundukense]